jgi:ATP-binding cassette subfamily F protein 3
MRLQLQQAANLETKRKHLQDFVDRFRAKATKARQAQSRLKQLEKMQIIEVKPLMARSRIQLPEPFPTGKEVLKLQDAELGYTANTILKNVNLLIEREQRYGVVGFNGAGKSTLLKTLAQRIPLQNGTCNYGYKVEYSYFAQHLTEDLILDDSVLDSLQRKAYQDTTAQEILNIAGSLLFAGDDVHKKVKVLSGGEKTRVALGQILLQKKPVLIMDEPTNHLDFDTVQALAQALTEFKGTLLVVSHDRSFINRVASKIIEIRNGSVELYPGTYEEYLWSLEKGALKLRYEVQDQKSAEVDIVKDVFKKPNFKETQKKINGEIKELERKILKTEEILNSLAKKIESINTELLTTSGINAQKLAQEAAVLSGEIATSEEALLVHMENLELKQKELENLH